MCLYRSYWELKETCRERSYFSWKWKLSGGRESFLEFESRSKNGWPGAIAVQSASLISSGPPLPIFSFLFWCLLLQHSRIQDQLPSNPLIGKSLQSGFEAKKPKAWSNQKEALWPSIAVSFHYLMSPRKLKNSGSTLLSKLALASSASCMGPSDSFAVNILGNRTPTRSQCLQSATLMLECWFQSRSYGRASKWRHPGQAQSRKPCLSNKAVENHRWAECVPSSLGEVRLAPSHHFLAFLKRPVRSRSFPSMKSPYGLGASHPQLSLAFLWSILASSQASLGGIRPPAPGHPPPLRPCEGVILMHWAANREPVGPNFWKEPSA